MRKKIETIGVGFQNLHKWSDFHLILICSRVENALVPSVFSTASKQTTRRRHAIGMGGAAPARLPLPHPRPPRLHSHQSTPVPYLHASAPAAATSATLSVPRPARSPSVRVARPRRRAAMSAAAASSSIGKPATHPMCATGASSSWRCYICFFFHSFRKVASCEIHTIN